MNRFHALALLWIAGIGVSMAAAPAFAAGNQNAKFALHLKGTTQSQKTICSTWAPTNIPCTGYVTAGRTYTNLYAYLVVAQGDPTAGIAGLSCGIEYGSHLLVGWQRCSDLEFPSGSWPANGGGNRITWANQTHCQRGVVPGYESLGVHAIAGWFSIYAYAADQFTITPNRRVPTPELLVADCNAAEAKIPFTAVGSAVFTTNGTVGGVNPCTGTGGVVPPVPEPSLLFHIGSVVPPAGACAAVPTHPSEVVTSAPARADGTADYFVYLLATPVYGLETHGLSAIQLGIDYQQAGPGAGLHVWSWQNCGVGEALYGGWPADGGGNTIVWTPGGCPQDSLVSAGYLYLTAYSPEILGVTGHPLGGLAKMADCEGQAGVLDHVIPASRMGWVSFGGAASGLDHDGCNPAVESCEQPIPVKDTTWGRIKSKY